jgi:hypothetical protein
VRCEWEELSLITVKQQEISYHVTSEYVHVFITHTRLLLCCLSPLLCCNEEFFLISKAIYSVPSALAQNLAQNSFKYISFYVQNVAIK